ncbi:hypothetical protein D3C73_1116830 [compost metagenome]
MRLRLDGAVLHRRQFIAFLIYKAEADNRQPGVNSQDAQIQSLLYEQPGYSCSFIQHSALKRTYVSLLPIITKIPPAGRNKFALLQKPGLLGAAQRAGSTVLPVQKPARVNTVTPI